MTILDDRSYVIDLRAVDVLADADAPVAGAWSGLIALASSDPPPVGLGAGERPAADVELLAGAVAAAEYLLAMRMHAAATAGCLPFGERGAMLAARGWSVPQSRRLARCGALATAHPDVAGPWAAGIITSEHVDAVARGAERFSPDELDAVLAALSPHWGSWSPAAVARFAREADRLLHPPPDPQPDESDAHESRSLSFAVTSDSVVLSGSLPRLEGELVIAAVDAFAEQLRSTADHVPAGARRADALVELVNAAHARGALPTRGGLPVSVTVTLDHTALGDPTWATSRGHLLTDSEQRFAACDGLVTPVLVDCGPCEAGPHITAEFLAAPSVATAPTEPAAPTDPAAPTASPSPATRLAALAAVMFDSRIPLAVGRAQRTATPAQRRCLAVRDRGCIIPGCAVPAEACQVHHLREWADGGGTDLDNMALLCWTHHRQVDLRMWTVQPLGPGGPPRAPPPGAPPGADWPANHGAPFTIARVPRTRWRT